MADNVENHRTQQAGKEEIAGARSSRKNFVCIRGRSCRVDDHRIGGTCRP